MRATHSCLIFVVILHIIIYTNSHYVMVPRGLIILIVPVAATPLPYSGALQLTALLSTDVARVYYGGEWQPLCGDNINKVLGDTACRQLGYTHSVNINTT